MSAARATTVLLGMAAAAPTVLAAQGYRLALDSRVQAVAYQGVTLDSVPSSATVTGPTGGPTTTDGYAVSCNPNGYCTFFRPGPAVHAAPVTTTADVTVWGLGVPGLSVRAIGRAVGDLSSADNWPGTSSHVQLLEGYAQYARDWLTAQVGRQTVATRFGFTGFDGGRVTVREARRPGTLELVAYGGWGLWSGAALPVTSPALNPLGEFRPPERQLIAGASGALTTAWADVRLSYERQVDPSVDYFVSERAGVDAVVWPVREVSLAGGAEYDIAEGWWGSARATVTYTAPSGRVSATAGVRRYRPHFDLWSIWAAFSPVPYTAWEGSVSLKPLARLEVRTRGEHYSFAAAAAATPLVSVESSGWRFSWGATYRFSPLWVVDGGYHAEFGPGASSRGFEGGVTYAPGERLSLTAHAATLDRPLEFRFDQASLTQFGLAGEYRPTSRVRFQLDASSYAEDRKRPDAAAFSWDAVRVSARLVLVFGGGGADLSGVPPAVRNMPNGGGSR